jgi:hypothetical protein
MTTTTVPDKKESDASVGLLLCLGAFFFPQIAYLCIHLLDLFNAYHNDALTLVLVWMILWWLLFAALWLQLKCCGPQVPVGAIATTVYLVGMNIIFVLGIAGSFWSTLIGFELLFSLRERSVGLGFVLMPILVGGPLTFHFCSIAWIVYRSFPEGKILA